MTITVFTWDMFRKDPKGERGVGHASMFVQNKAGNFYISFWPSAHNIFDAIYSTGKVHFMKGDIAHDGQPSWASKPIENLDETKILNFWKGFDSQPFIDYKNKNSNNFNKNFEKSNEGGRKYDLLYSQCSTTVANALYIGSDNQLQREISNWIHVKRGSNDILGFAAAKMLPSIPTTSGLPKVTITPADVKQLVKDIWDDY